VLLRGERPKLDEVRSSEEIERLLVRAATVVDNVGAINAVTGESLAQGMARFQRRRSSSPDRPRASLAALLIGWQRNHANGGACSREAPTSPTRVAAE
jgi:hypothetical protein